MVLLNQIGLVCGLCIVALGIFTLRARALWWRWHLEWTVHPDDREHTRPSSTWDDLRKLRGWGAVVVGGLVVLYNAAAWIRG